MTTITAIAAQAADELRSAQLEVGRLLDFAKSRLPTTSPERLQEILERALEKVDDKLFNALTHLGE